MIHYHQTWAQFPLVCFIVFPVLACISINIIDNTVGPLLSGHPGDFENWPLNRDWPLNRGIEYSTLLTTD